MQATLISPGEVGALLKKGGRLNIIDVRSPAEFANVHVVGARSVPLDRLDPQAEAARRANEGDPLYVICQAGGRAASACKRFAAAGVGNVLSIEGGTAAWEKLGLPVERGGGKVISLERQVRIVAGLLVLVGTILAWAIHPVFLVIPAFVGAGLTFAGITDFCGMGILLGKMPWNRRAACGGGGGGC